MEGNLKPGEQRHGFRIEKVTPLPDVQMTAIQAVHERSGARFLHLAARDDENLMAVGFRTPPPDDTGLPHILEHTVLCGSRRYPVKDPFVELLKTSLATFLNAMTYPDRTVYPCASMNRRDFFNVAGVYLDAVFHPLITEKHFKQEGHHFDFQTRGDPASPLKIKGIVYNEMRGVYSTLDGHLWRASESLFPDNAYGRDSGGDPAKIPELTYPQFADFHARYYHPSNSFFFFYGDIPTDDHLSFLHENALREYTRIDVETTIPLQPRWSGPRRLTAPYPAAPDDRPAGKSCFAMAWLMNPLADPVETFAQSVLGAYLLGHEGSPLHKALMDSGLGGELTFDGYMAFRRETMFGVGMKETSPKNAERIEALVLEQLRDLANRGLEKDRIESCFHQIEIGARDVPGNYPLVLMDRVFNAWMYDVDPLQLVRVRAHLAELRRRYEREPRFFESRIERDLVGNPHRLSILLTPDADWTARQDRERAERLAARKAALSPEDLDRIVREATELDAMQESPNTPESLATLPRLRMADVPAQPQPLPVEKGTVAGRPLLRPEAFSNGLVHFTAAIDLNGIDEALIDYLPLFADALTGMGAAGRDYAAMAERETAACAGISASIGVGGTFSDPYAVGLFLHLSSRALEEKAADMMTVLGERWLGADFSDRKRLKDLVVESAIERRESVMQAGNTQSLRFAGRRLSRNAELSERFSGVTQARFVRDLQATFESRAEEIADRLNRIHAFIRSSARLHAGVVGADEPFGVVSRRLESWMKGMTGPAPAPAASAVFQAQPVIEGIALPLSIAYVARIFHARPPSDPLAPALMVLAGQLSYGFLWNEVRVRRGAYGCHASYDQSLGLFGLSSYRDPGIRETLAVYDRVVDHVLNEMDLSDRAVEQYVIGAFKQLDAPIRPARALSMAMSRHLTGMTEEDRAAFRGRLRAVGAKELRAAAEHVLREGLRAAPTAIISGREKMTDPANRIQGLRLEEF